VLRVRRRPSQSGLERLLVEARSSKPAYPEVGATRNARLPNGYRHDLDTRVLPAGDGVFERAVPALRSWQAQVGAGIEVFPHQAWVDVDETVLLLIGFAGLWATAACRIVYVEEEPNRFEFAYGTLPGHPERGEVSFRVVRAPDGRVTFQVRSFSRPADPLARLAAPLARRLQRRVTRRYLDAIADASR
jgi:uncharacterized protein (UPF0548 family)